MFLTLTDGLKKETSVDIAGGIIGQHLTFTAYAYRIDVKDRIQLSGGIDVSKIAAFTAAGFTQTANVFVNALDTRTTGFEFVAGYHTAINTDSKISFNAAYSYMSTDTLAVKKPAQALQRLIMSLSVTSQSVNQKTN